MEVQQIASERRSEALNSMDAVILDADLRQEAKIQQEVELRQESELRLLKVKTTEEGEGSRESCTSQER